MPSDKKYKFKITLVALVSDDKSEGIKMQIVFKRRLTNELLTSYLPTLLFILIEYGTTFFKSFFFEAALTVNLTTMLVMTTIFISVMEKLPPTSYVRMVDVWLIFSILIPFIEVCILTLKEYYRDELQMINHHGRPRKVSNNLLAKEAGEINEKLTGCAQILGNISIYFMCTL